MNSNRATNAIARERCFVRCWLAGLWRTVVSGVQRARPGGCRWPTRVSRSESFERAGWENPGVVARYHEHLSGVTTQSTEALLDAARVRHGSRVLDVATGAGYVAGAAARRGAEAIGMDFSAAQVRMARERYPGVRFEQADAEALPFDPDSFDAVVTAFGLCHFPNPDVALREACRVLRHGGRVAFTVWDTPERAVAFGATALKP